MHTVKTTALVHIFRDYNHFKMIYHLKGFSANVNTKMENEELQQRSQQLDDEINDLRQQLQQVEQQIRQRLQQLLQLDDDQLEHAALHIDEIIQELNDSGFFNKGLTAERIEKFDHFTADESLVGDQCIVCLDDLKVGTKMVRLDCHVSHYLCKTCTDNWFKDHNKCPLCNHVFN